MDPDLESTQQQSLSPDGISWLDDSSDGLTPMKDPFWSALTSISDRLQIQGRIGKGGMSVVYKAMHLSMKKPVAVKLLLPHLTSDPKSLRRFRLEAQATANLNHPNIVRVYDCGMSEDQAFIIMDYIEGKSLEQVIDDDGALAPERALEIFVQLCEGINHAHEQGIVHRDLKPSNVMLTDEMKGADNVKIVDFGIAKLLFDDDGSTMQKLTQTGDVFGSPLYMSPEQCGGQKIDSRSDIYSAGCLMYEALAGRPPIVGKNFLDTMQKHATDLPKPFVNEVTGSKLAKRMQKIIFTCLAKEPSARYQSMKAVADDLRTASQPEAVRLWKEREKSLSEIVRQASRKTRLIRRAVASVAVLALGGTALAFASQINDIMKPSGYADKPLFEIASIPRQTIFGGFEKAKQDIIVALDRTEASDEAHKENGLETAAVTYFDYGRWSEAKLEYEKLLKLPVGLEKFGEYHCGLGLCALALNDFAKAKEEFKASINYYLQMQNGYQRGDDNPTIVSLLSGIYGIKAREPIKFLALTEERLGNLQSAQSNAKVLLVSGRADDSSERPGEHAYVADLSRRLRKYGDALITFQNLRSNESVVPERNYRTKLDFAIGLCLLASNEPGRAATAFKTAADEGGTDKDMMEAIDREYHRSLWLSGDRLAALFAPHTLKVVAAEPRLPSP